MKKKNFFAITLTAILMLSFVSIISIQPAYADNVTGYDSIEEIDGIDWYFWDNDIYGSIIPNRRSAIVLYDGGCDYFYVTIDSLEDQYTEARMDLINNLTANGYDVLTPAETWSYSSSNNAWLTAAAEYLKAEYAGLVTLFGWGTGGAAVGYEIQKTGAENLYTCAVIAAAPVAIPLPVDSVYHSGFNAGNTKVPVAFICNGYDDEYYGSTYTQMQTYYNGMPAGLAKEWHSWNEGANDHDPFPDTCSTHGGETVSDVTYNFEITVEGWGSTESIGGKNWYYWDCDSDSVAILIFGGLAFPTSVLSWNFGSAATLNFINELHASGIDVVALTSATTYYSTNTWVRDTAAALKNPAGYDYDEVCVFGHSAGGVVVGNEILKTSADSYYDAAVLATAPVDWYPTYTDPLYNTADNAGNAKVRTSFIKADDDFEDDVELYHDNFNSSLDKELHHWDDEESPPDAHDIFPDTCDTHPGETLADVLYYWITRPTYQLTIQAYNQYMQSGYGIEVYIDGEYAGTTFNNFELTHGKHTIEVETPVGTSVFDHYSGISGTTSDNPVEIWITANDNLYAWYYTY